MLSRLLSRRLLGALAVSALLHWLFVSGNADWLPGLIAEPDPIEVTLALPPPAAKPVAPPIRQPVPKTRPQSPAAKPVPPPKSVEPPPTPPPPSPAAQDLPEPPPAVEEVKTDPPASPAPENIVQDEPTPVPPAPKKVEIEFSGNNGSKGTGKQTFERSGDNGYIIGSELSIPAFLFVSASIEQRSEGLITPTGLQPLSYRQKVTTRNPQIAKFDWDSKKVTLDGGKRTDVVDLPAATQDRLSFMYQFMFVPPLDEMHLNLTDGKKLKTYLYEFEGEDTLSTKMGSLRTWHIAKSNRDSDAKTELWLALDYRYLPVRIRVTEKDGSVTDLIVSNLKIEQP